MTGLASGRAEFRVLFEIAGKVLDVRLRGLSEPPATENWERLRRFRLDSDDVSGRGPDVLVELDIADRVPVTVDDATMKWNLNVYEGGSPSARRFVRPEMLDWICHREPVRRVVGRCVAGWDLWLSACRVGLLSALEDESNCLILHASAVAGPAGAVLFSGPSGVGKTTAARFRPEGTWIIADELVVLTVGYDSGTTVFSFPFAGTEMGSPGPFDLRHLVFLETGRTDAIESISLAEGLRRLVQELRVINPAMLSLSERLLKQTPFHILHRRPGRGFWALVEQDCLGFTAQGSSARLEVDHG